MVNEGCADYIKENREGIVSKCPQLNTDVHFGDSQDMSEVDGESVELVVTSPPYPMVEMWDHLGDYEDQHKMIANVLEECYRVLVDGGMACINIGDATRVGSDGDFQLHPNSAEITMNAKDIGFSTLIPIYWKKPTNKGTSFFGSGFTPPNGYVTLDFEHILILRKGGKRTFSDDTLRQASRFTMEQRNKWFSQEWEIPGESQDGRATFPPEIPYRLIRMFSCIGDTVLDPFLGSGTTIRMARAVGRSAIGYEIDESRLRAMDELTGPGIEEVLSRLVRHEERGLEGTEPFLSGTSSLLDY